MKRTASMKRTPLKPIGNVLPVNTKRANLTRVPFGARLKELLGKYKRSQRYLARASGVNYVTINRIVNHYPFGVTKDTALKLADGLGCTRKERDELLGLTGNLPQDVKEILLNRPDLVEMVRREAKR